MQANADDAACKSDCTLQICGDGFVGPTEACDDGEPCTAGDTCAGGACRLDAAVGSGLGTFDPAFRRFEPFEMLSTSYMNQAHSDLLQLVIEAGAFGLALLLVYLAWWGRRTIALWRAAPDRAAPPLLGRLGSVVTAMILLSSVAEYPLRTPFFAVLFVIASVWMTADRTAAGTGDRRGPAADQAD